MDIKGSYPRDSKILCCVDKFTLDMALGFATSKFSISILANNKTETKFTMRIKCMSCHVFY